MKRRRYQLFTSLHIHCIYQGSCTLLFLFKFIIPKAFQCYLLTSPHFHLLIIFVTSFVHSCLEMIDDKAIMAILNKPTRGFITLEQTPAIFSSQAFLSLLFSNDVNFASDGFLHGPNSLIHRGVD